MTPEGSLRDRLITAGLTLIERDGVAGMTLRKTAALAGVSHAAPAHHFDGLSGLLTAMAARAFQLFAEALIAGRDRAGDDPFQRLLGLTQGYLDFAKDHAGLFHLMFVAPEVDRSDPALMPHAALSYQVLRDSCLPFAMPGAAQDPVLETAVWSLVHGYAMLGFAASGHDRPAGPVPFPVLLQELLSARRSAPPNRA